MKKLISIVLVLVMVLALGAVAFADSSIYVTKHPTDEVRSAGGTAWFVSGAASYSSLSWTFQAPDGTQYSVQDFRTHFPYATVEGENTTTLTIRNLGTDMNGWGVFCSFFNGYGQTDTAMAFLYVSAYVAPTYSQPTYSTPTYTVPVNAIPNGGQFGGYGYDENGHLEYDVYYDDGSYTTYYYDGSSLTNNLDGSYYYQTNDGGWDVFNEDGYHLSNYPDGSYLEEHADGSWEAYDASTGTYTSGWGSWGD